MAEVIHRSAKPLQVNPFKLSQPMGAALAFFGVDRCMPLMHGGQGCTSFTKVFFTRHFCEPIAIQTTAVTDITAILDGGDVGITEAVHNLCRKVTPSLIGLHTTGLSETKGDDIRGIAGMIEAPLVYVNTPDYEGGFASGWALATRAMIEQLVTPQTQLNDNRVVLLPHASLRPIEVEKIKEFIAAFGFNVLALPDLSTSLDGYLGEKQSALSGGGISLEEIRGLAAAGLVISVGASMRSCAAALQAKNRLLRHQHFDHLQGLFATDRLVELLLTEAGLTRPPAAVERWRSRLQDVMLDGHFTLGQCRFLLTGEPDQLAGLAAALHEVGGKLNVAIATVDSPQLEKLPVARVLVGDLEDAENSAADFDVMISNGHAEALAHRRQKGLLLRGLPNWEQLGDQLKNDILYEGGCYFLLEAVNTALKTEKSPAEPERSENR
ncbi:MAG: nitrogenase iron-molybdenum cofactor biosynthesis protein NifN [Deltaproteobacteria bacterium]|nr:nitrogenase iron-molybdenum cofactor biosynthesis protein NifN [Deltaproteobacteria bacterium]